MNKRIGPVEMATIYHRRAPHRAVADIRMLTDYHRGSATSQKYWSEVLAILSVLTRESSPSPRNDGPLRATLAERTNENPIAHA